MTGDEFFVIPAERSESGNPVDFNALLWNIIPLDPRVKPEDDRERGGSSGQARG